MTSSPRILTYDIESSPNVAHVWGLFNQTVSLSQLMQSTQVICWAAKWHDSRTVHFMSEHHNTREEMVRGIWELLSAADIVVHYNGDRFDTPHVNREFLQLGLPPPAPTQSIDLLKVARSRFKFASNKLEHVARELGLGGKLQHSGHSLWVRCMVGDDKAWAEMRRYCKKDVVLEEQVFDVLRPWIRTGLNMGLWIPGDVCPRCGSKELERRGFAHTTISTFQRFRCKNCKSWSRGATAVARTTLRGIA